MVDPLCDPFCDHNRIIFNMNTVFCLTIVKGLVKLSIVLIILEILIILIIINIMPKKLWLFWRRCVPLGWGGRAPSKQGRSPRCESIYTTNYFFASSKKVFIVIKILLTQKPFIVSHWNFKIFFDDDFDEASLSHVNMLKTLTMTKMMTIASKRHAAHCQHVHSVCLVGQHQLFHFLKTLAPPKQLLWLREGS